jgi:hypothetical protein
MLLGVVNHVRYRTVSPTAHLAGQRCMRVHLPDPQAAATGSVRGPGCHEWMKNLWVNYLGKFGIKLFEIKLVWDDSPYYP